MKLQKHQQGITFIGIVFILLLIGFVTFTVLKLFPAYMQNFNVASSLKGMEAEKSREYLGAAEVRDSVLRRFDINEVEQAGKDDISITRDGKTYLIDVDYEVVILYISNVSLLISFTNHAEVTAQ